MYCPGCGKEVAGNDRFCRFCGGSLPEAGPDAPEPTPTDPLAERPAAEDLRERAAAAVRAKKRRPDWAVIPALLALVAIVVILLFLMRTRIRPDQRTAAQPSEATEPAPETAPAPAPQVHVPPAPQPAQPAAPVEPPAESPAESPEPAPQPSPREATSPPQPSPSPPPAPQPRATGPPAASPQPAPRTGPGPVPKDYHEFWFRPAQYTGFSDQLEDLTDMELDSNVAHVHVRLDRISRFAEGGTIMTWEGYDRRGRLVRRERRPLTMVDAGWLGILGVDPSTVGQYQPRP